MFFSPLYYSFNSLYIWTFINCDPNKDKKIQIFFSHQTIFLLYFIQYKNILAHIAKNIIKIWFVFEESDKYQNFKIRWNFRKSRLVKNHIYKWWPAKTSSSLDLHKCKVWHLHLMLIENILIWLVQKKHMKTQRNTFDLEKTLVMQVLKEEE